jgi:hypothetical protein
MENNLPAYPGDVISSVPVSDGRGNFYYYTTHISTDNSGDLLYREQYPLQSNNSNVSGVAQTVRELQAAVQALTEEVKQLKEIHNNRLPAPTIQYRKMNI